MLVTCSTLTCLYLQKISMRANNGVHKEDEVCILEVCVCYLQISCNC